MKNYLFVALLSLAVASCSPKSEPTTIEPVAKVTAETNNLIARTATAQSWDDFSNVPQAIREQAQQEWGDVPPALTIAFTYDRKNLEDGWAFNIYNTKFNCTVGENSDYYGREGLATQNGFVFLTEDDLCGMDNYILDNRQGGWFDYVCGPGNVSFSYDGNSQFLLVHLWCE